MNRRVISVVAGFLLLVGITAVLLVRVRANYVLGEPGVKIVNVPIYNEDTNIVSEISAYLPERVGEYTSARVEPVTKIEQGWLPPDTVYGRRVYKGPNKFESMVSVVVMGTDRTSIHKPQYCLTGQGEQIVGSEVISIPIEAPHPYELKVMKLSTRSQRLVAKGKFVPVNGIFLYWFVADGHLTPSHETRMWLMAKDLLTKGRLQRWAYVAYYGVCIPGQDDVLLEQMKRFVSTTVPEFQVTTGSPKNAETAMEPGKAVSELAQN